MSGRRQVEELLQGLHAARIEGSLERVCACFSPDARLRIAGSSDGKPIAIAAAGISQIRPWLGILVKTFRLMPAAAIAIGLPSPEPAMRDRKSTPLNSRHSQISYAAFCMKNI